jgi:tryptophan synthase alpha chain
VTRLQQSFERALETKHAALMPYLTVGFPSDAAWVEIVPEMVRGGADVIELGLPFSDPLADGPTIQEATFRVLQGNFSVGSAFDQIGLVRARVPKTPLVLMTYFNLVLQHGLEKFVARSKAAGLDALLIPDLPIEECGELRVACDRQGLDLVQMVSPNISDERLARVCGQSRGFIYAVAVEGATGAREGIVDVADYIARIRNHSSLPVALGFGISNPEQAREYAASADGVIIGSALIKIVAEDSNPPRAAYEFIASVDRALQT